MRGTTVIRVYVLTLDGVVASSVVQWGRDVQAELGGPIANATFLEPVGIALTNGIVVVACFGGDAGSVEPLAGAQATAVGRAAASQAA
jgi:hypothetical protein